MTITAAAKAEADYYLGLDSFERIRVTEADYEEWFRHDARGEPCHPENPIQCAKAHYGIWIKELKRMRFSQGLFDWPGGIYLLDLPLRVLLEAFDRKSVEGWVREVFG